MKVPDVRRNLVPDTWTADGEVALPELGPCPRDNSCVGCRGTELATSRFFCVEFDDIVEVRWPTFIKSQSSLYSRRPRFTACRGMRLEQFVISSLS